MKLIMFIGRKSRPKLIVSDNGGTFKATAAWIKKTRKSEQLGKAGNQLGVQFVQISLVGKGMCERLLKNIKEAPYKVTG